MQCLSHMDVSEFEPENLHETWKLLAGYIEGTRKFAPNLQQNYPEAFETWGLITQLYDAYKVNDVETELQKRIGQILSRAPMPQIFDKCFDDDMIYLRDLLVYIKKEL